MNSRSVTAIGLVLFFWFSTSPAAELAERLVYSRADVVSVVTGVTWLRRAYTHQMKLPSPTCEGRPLTCSVDRLYGQVYILSFVEETMTRGTGGTPTIDRRERGRLAMAMEFSKKDENDFEDALLEHIQKLGVAAFARPQAGMAYLEDPMSMTMLEKSAAPAWVCAELDGAYHYDLVAENGGFSNIGQPAKDACLVLEQAGQDVQPMILRTMPDIRNQLRQEVRLATSSTLRGLTWADRLASVPEGATFKKAALDGDRKTGSIRDVRNGAFVGHEGRYGTEYDAVLPRASLDLSEVPMQILRWSFDATRERFGADPKSDHDKKVSLLVAVAPIADGLMTELEKARTTLSVPDEAVLKAAIARFTAGATLGPSLVSEALADPTIWPASGNWIVVTCRDDGSARYGITPFAEAAQVANPQETCAAIRRKIAE